MKTEITFNTFFELGICRVLGLHTKCSEELLSSILIV